MIDSQQTTAIEQPARHAVRLPYLPGLDGLRAIAVIGVLLYHADLGVWGGFLGVESFFVLSGFLITALLLAEWRQNGRIELRDFWLRRARRLLPALRPEVVRVRPYPQYARPGGWGQAGDQSLRSRLGRFRLRFRAGRSPLHRNREGNAQLGHVVN